MTSAPRSSPPGAAGPPEGTKVELAGLPVLAGGGEQRPLPEPVVAAAPDPDRRRARLLWLVYRLRRAAVLLIRPMLAITDGWW